MSAVDAFSGLSAGVVGTVVGHPLDVVKTRMQTAQSPSSGILRTMFEIGRTEGIRQGLYRGIAPPLLSLSILNTLSFTCYSSLLREIQTVFPTSLSLAPFTAGALTGFLASWISTPFEFLKVRMQTHVKAGGTSLAYARQVLKTNGFKAFYTGFAINSTREVLFCFVYFGSYESFKNSLVSALSVEQKHTWNTSAIALSGGLAGASAWFVSFPLDTIKSHIQGIGKDGSRASFSEAFNKISCRGIQGFYSGIGPSILRSFLVSSTRFSVFESTRSILLSYLPVEIS